MKRIALSTFAFSLLMLVACNKQINHKATVVRDCTGVYLRVNEKDYHVCNVDKLSSFPDGSLVNARFERKKDCRQEEEKMVCKMYHQNEGWIEVTLVK